MRREKIFAAIAGLLAALISATAACVPWAWVGVNTYAWGDGCPDVFKIAPLWWRVVFFFILTPLLVSLCIYIGLRIRRLNVPARYE
jgi:hypothetical protein